MDLDYAILADGVSNRPDGKIDIFGAGFDTVLAASVPVRHQQLSLALRLLLSKHELEEAHNLKVFLLGEDGAELARLEAQVDPAPEAQRNRIPAGKQAGIGAVFNMAGVVFPSYGTYHFSLHWDGNELRQPIRLTVAPVPENTA